MSRLDNEYDAGDIHRLSVLTNGLVVKVEMPGLNVVESKRTVWWVQLIYLWPCLGG